MGLAKGREFYLGACDTLEEPFLAAATIKVGVDPECFWQRVRAFGNYPFTARTREVCLPASSVRFQFKSKWAPRVQAVLRRRDRSRPSNGVVNSPAVPVSADWDAAYTRVESYLRAHHIESRVLLNHLTSEILAGARELAARHPEEAPVTLAIRVTQARIGEWLVRLLGEGDWTDERFRARGRLALLLSDLPRGFPESFLSSQPLPNENQARLKSAALQPSPELKFTNMPPAPLEFPLDEAVQEKWITFCRSTFLQTSMSWLVIASLAGVAWLFTR